MPPKKLKPQKKPKSQFWFVILASWINDAAKESSAHTKIVAGGEEKAIIGATSTVPRQVNLSWQSAQQKEQFETIRNTHQIVREDGVYHEYQLRLKQSEFRISNKEQPRNQYPVSMGNRDPH